MQGSGVYSRRSSRDILEVSQREGTDPGLLAVTWGHESSFSYNPPPNPRWNEARTRIIGYDVGPTQVANTIWNRSPFTDGLPNAFGTDIGAAQFGQRSPFNGNAFNNLSVGARALNDGMGRPGRPRGVSALADAAGIFRAGPSRKGSYWTRVREYNADHRAYDRFFNCMRGLPY